MQLLKFMEIKTICKKKVHRFYTLDVQKYPDSQYVTLTL